HRLLPLLGDDATTLHAPELLDVEVAQVVRRYCRRGQISIERAGTAIKLLADLDVARHGHAPLLPRIWALRDNLTAYDAAYVALAEALDAPLLTRDGQLARSSGHTARIELV
ncbi:MAG TPA: VapC toxin family PIN domain ribonuclease, partial [Acidobacteria bacterium]|nr:VapC toxin family PIN domain ribonuclease [Acidobacteriota bacterium]